MANLSNRTTSKNTAATPINTQRTMPVFKAGDKVLCPTIGDGIYTVQQSIIGRYLTLEGDPINRLFDTDGTFKDGYSVQLFHNTPANRQAIRQLFGVNVPFYPNHWEREHGFIKDGVFHCPHFHIKKNGEPLDVDRVTHSYRYTNGFQVLMHLQASSDDIFELVPLMWQPMPNAILDDLLDGHTEGKEGLYE